MLLCARQLDDADIRLCRKQIPRTLASAVRMMYCTSRANVYSSHFRKKTHSMRTVDATISQEKFVRAFKSADSHFVVSRIR